MNRRIKQALTAFVGVFAIGLVVTPEARGHETDQYTLPHGRQFADIGPYLNAYMYDAIAEGVRKVNERITAAANANRTMDVKRLQEDGEIVRAVNSAFPNAMAVIEGLDSRLGSRGMRDAYPGEVCGYKESFTNIYEHAHFILDPRQLFRVWLAKTFVVYGTYLGGDKIGHFTDMGMNYWRAYDAARRKGANEEEATAAAVSVGTEGLIFSEKGMLGYLSAGAYSNGDMLSNYIGFVFYRNLTSPMMLKGRLQPAMLALEGDRWTFAPHVKRDNDFFAIFIDDHFNEAFNPSHYESAMRGKIREAIKQRQSDVLERYADANGCRRPMEWFETTAKQCASYYGVDYGHRGAHDELLTLGQVCFDPLPPDASPNERNDRGYTPVHDAVIRGDLARLRSLLDSGADANAAIRSDEPYSSEWGATALHLAARDGRRDIIQLLLDSGADVRVADDRGATALHYGAGSAEIVTVLTTAGADANARDATGRTPLHWAANLGSSEGVDALAARGADMDAADRGGVTALHFAAQRGDALVVARLLDSGAAPTVSDRFGRTPLHYACAHDEPETVTILLQRGANAAAKDAFGVTPLHDAARLGRVAMAEALLARGGQADTADYSRITPLHLAARGGHVACVEAILKRGGNANARSNAGVTPLHEAAFAGSGLSVAALTKAGSDRMAKDAQGRTPRDVAQTRGHRDLFAMLVATDSKNLRAESRSAASDSAMVR